MVYSPDLVKYCMDCVLLGLCTVQLIAREAHCFTEGLAASADYTTQLFKQAGFFRLPGFLSDWKEPYLSMTFVACLWVD